jgi:hypothetical protein
VILRWFHESVLRCESNASLRIVNAGSATKETALDCE